MWGKSNEDFEVNISFWHTPEVLNKLIIILGYYFMFKDQMVFLESTAAPTLISVANANMHLKNALYPIFQGILKYIFEMQIFTTQ